MKCIDSTGKNVEAAIECGLNQLKVAREEVEVEVIDEGSKGFLNLIGTRPAKVKIKVKKDYVKDARHFLKNILDSMNIEAEIRIKEEKSALKIELKGPDMGIIIGHRGETLDSLQYLVSLVVNKNNNFQYKRIILDTENYRSKRENTLKRLARKLSSKVKKTGKPIKLEPMNPYERRIIHSELQIDDSVETHSEGEEPFRKVVINLRKA